MLALRLLIPNNHIDILILSQPLQKLRVRTVRRFHIEEFVHTFQWNTLCFRDKEEAIGC